MIFENKRLHPLAILFRLFEWIKGSLFLLIIFFITWEFTYFIYGLLVYLLLLTISAVLYWLRFSYRLEENELVIEYGLLKRTKRSISKNRIQSIDLTESVFHRLFKLVRVQIETATTGLKAEAYLSAVTLEEGKNLRAQLKSINDVEGQEAVTLVEEKPLQRMVTKRELLLFGITSGGVGVIIGSIFVLFSEFAEHIPDQIYNSTQEFIVASSIIAIVTLIALLLIVIWLISVGLTFIRYGKFTIRLKDDELLISRGLLEKKQLTIPLDRIQAVGIEENIFRQPLGYVTVFAEIAGGTANQKEDVSAILFPVMKKKEVKSFFDTFTPRLHWEEEMPFVKPTKSARKFYLTRSLIIPFIILVGIIYFYPPFAWIALLFFPIAFILGWMRYRDAGFYLKENRLFIRYRLLKRVTVQVYHRRIQAFREKQHYIQKRAHVATITASIVSRAGGQQYTLKDLRESDTEQLTAWYSYRGND